MAKESKKIFKKYDSQKDLLDYEFSYNDEETQALHVRINNNPGINIDDLRRVALWKINRVLGVSEETLEKLQELASRKAVSIDDELVKEIIGDLVDSQGIGFPMASAILKVIKPDVFPIIDVRAYRALTGEKLYYSTYNYTRYVDYVKQLKGKAALLNRPLREMDEQLYRFDQEHNGKI